MNLRFVALTACLFLLPYAAISYHFISQSGKRYGEEVLRLLSVRAQISSRLAQEALASSYELDALVASPGFRAASWAERGRLLSAAQKASPDLYFQITLADASGKALLSAGNFSADKKNFSGDEIFTQTMRGQTLGRVSRFADMPPVLVASEPVYCKEGAKPCGAVFSIVSLARLYELVRISRAGYEPGETFVTDGDGLIIADSKGLSAQTPGVGMPAQVMPLLRDGEVSRYVTIPGRGHFFVARSSVEGTSWHAVEMEPAPLWAAREAGDAKLRVVAGALLIILFAFLLERVGSLLLIPRH